jgi:hypothetical protein
LSIFPILDVDDSVIYDPTADVQPKEAFYAHGFWWYGRQSTVWKSDDMQYGGPWDFDNYGRWIGGGSVLAVPSGLRVQGQNTPGVVKQPAPGFGPGFLPDPVCHIAAGQPLRASCGLHDWFTMYEDTVGTLGWQLYSAATGALVSSGTAYAYSTEVGSNVWTIPAQPAGSYLLCAHLTNVVRPYTLPPGYVMADQYKYEEEGMAYGWNPIENVGRPPADPNHPLWAKRRELLNTNQITDPPQYTPYRSSALPLDGEWSFIKVRIGDGTGTQSWSVAPDVSPNPGWALDRDDTESGGPLTLTPIPFDPMVRSVTSFAQTAQGVLVGGARATDTGPVMYLSRLHADGTATLLGIDLNPSTGMCECAKADHSVSRILELEDGTILVLSKCSLHRYDLEATSIATALPGVPAVTDGQPGGQCIIEVAQKTYHLTEYFGGDNSNSLHFYNTLLVQEGRNRVTRAGTVFHGPSSMTKAWGLPYGVTQDKSFHTPDAKQRITWWTGSRWSLDSGAVYEARTHNWQHMETGGDIEGSYLLVTGRNPLSGQDGICVVGTEYAWQEMEFPYRMRRLTKSLVGDEYIIAGPGRRVIDGQIENVWRMLKFTGRPRRVCGFWNATSQAFLFSQSEMVAAGIDLEKLPTALRWVAVDHEPAGGHWQNAVAPTAPPPYLERFTVTANVIGFRPGTGVTMPYAPELFEQICFTVRSDGSVSPEVDPKPSCTSAACVIDKMPEGSSYTVYAKQIFNTPWPGIQVNDHNRDKPLVAQQRLYPMLWGRFDSTADQDDLTTYTKRLTFGMYQSLMDDARQKIEVVVLTDPSCPAHEPPGIVIAP